MQLARAEDLDGCSLLLYPGLPLFTVGGFNSSTCKNILALHNTFSNIYVWSCIRANRDTVGYMCALYICVGSIVCITQYHMHVRSL